MGAINLNKKRSGHRLRPLKQIRRLLRGKDEIVILNGPVTYNEDGLATEHNADFMEDPAFKRAYAAGADARRGFLIHWRAYVKCWAAKRALDLDGDIVECGARGSTARMIVEYLRFDGIPRRYWMLDTFHDLVAAQISPAERERGISDIHYDDCYAEVQKIFSRYSNVEIVRGVVPDTLAQVSAEKVACLFIDMGCAAPEIAAAEFFWPKLTSGAVMVQESYGFRRHFEQKKAFDQFAARHGVMILPLPTGQALILKP